MASTDLIKSIFEVTDFYTHKSTLLDWGDTVSLHQTTETSNFQQHPLN